jgi:uncharacterized membrane protein YcaP (DUF421 family)
VFFDGWSALGRTAIVGVLAYLALVLLLRVSGKRTLSKMNAFDLIVTVALGSTLATVLLSRSVSLARWVLAFAVLIFLQLAITWLSVRSGMVRRLVKSEPTLLFFRGEFLRGSMKRERVTEDEIRAALRAESIAAIEDVEAVVLETESSFSVVKKPAGSPHSTLDDIVDRSTRDPHPDDDVEPPTGYRTSGGTPRSG